MDHSRDRVGEWRSAWLLPFDDLGSVSNGVAGYCGLGSSVRELAYNTEASSKSDFDSDAEVDVDVAVSLRSKSRVRDQISN